jgi:hypothetical protein
MGRLGLYDILILVSVFIGGLLIFINYSPESDVESDVEPVVEPDCGDPNWTCSSQREYSVCTDNLSDADLSDVTQYIFDYLNDNNLIVTSNITGTETFSKNNIILTEDTESFNNCNNNQIFRLICPVAQQPHHCVIREL